MKIVILLVALLSAFGWATTADAAAPEPLRGKSVTVTWTENRIQRNVGEQAFRSVAVGHQLQIYIGERGKVFSRLTFQNARGRTGQTDEVGGSGGTTRTPTFGKQSMTVFMSRGGTGARQVRVEFGPNFGSCTAQVIRGRAGGGLIRAPSPITGRDVEIQSAVASGFSCQVGGGNVFQAG